MSGSYGLQAVVGVTGFRATHGSVTVSGEHFVRIDLPDTATEEHLDLMRNDLRVLTQILDDHPRTLLDIQNAVLRNDIPTANRLANEVGLTEENMVANGGGMWGYILAAAVVIGAYAAFGGHHTETPHPPDPPPSPPPETTHPPDAGPG